MFKTKYFSLYFPILLTLFLCSFEISAKDNWIRVNSKNFHLIGNADEKDIRKVATKLEQFRETFRKLFSTASFDSAIPTNVIVFKSGSAYKPFKPKRADGKIDDFVAGYFMPGKDVNYITLSTEGEDADTFGTIFHEYVHFMVEMNFGKSEIPPWFNEGLAEYYQTFAIEKDQEVKLGIFQQGHINLLGQSKLMPLDTLFNVSNYQLHQQGNHSRSIFYAQSWALIHYLIQNPVAERRAGLDKFLNYLIKGVAPAEAFQKSFQMTYAEMENELKKYVVKASYQYQIFNFKQKLLFDAEMQVSPLSESETNAYLGDLLCHLHRTDDAEPFLQKALTLEPNSSMANTAMGTVKMQQRKFSEAKTYLEKAISDDLKNHMAYYNYAYLLSRENQDEFGFSTSIKPETAAKMREALKKSISINPSFTPSYELLAFVNLVKGENLDETVEMLKKALTYQPGDQQIILRIADIYARQEKFPQAKQLAEKIAATTDEPEIKSRAENLLSNIKTMDSIKAQNEAMRKEYEENKKKYEAQRNEAAKNGNRPVLTRRDRAEKTPEEIAKEEELAQILSINQALKQPGENEKQVIGRITKVACPPKMIVYTVKTDDGTVSLFSKDFQNLALVAFGSGAENAQLGCNANLTNFKAVLTYKPTKQTYAGELIAIDFVPDNFRFLTAQDVAATQEKQEETISETSTPMPQSTEIVKNNENVIIVDKPEDFEARRREMMMEFLKKSLRQPLDGESRVIGMLEKIECDKNGQYFVFQTASELIKLKANQSLQIKSFIPDLGGMRFECGLKQLNANAVITFKPSSDKKAKYNGDMVALEFVPNSFKLE